MGALPMDQAEGCKLGIPASALGYTESGRVSVAQPEVVKEKDE